MSKRDWRRMRLWLKTWLRLFGAHIENSTKRGILEEYPEKKKSTFPRSRRNYSLGMFWKAKAISRCVSRWYSPGTKYMNKGEKNERQWRNGGSRWQFLQKKVNCILNHTHFNQNQRRCSACPQFLHSMQIKINWPLLSPSILPVSQFHIQQITLWDILLCKNAKKRSVCSHFWSFLPIQGALIVLPYPWVPLYENIPKD